MPAKTTRLKQTTSPTEPEIKIPIAEGAEKSLIGLLLFNPQSFTQAIESGLTPDHFWIRSHKLVYTAMLNLHLNGVEEPNPNLIADYLKTHHQLDEVSGPAAIATMVDARAPGPSMLGALIEQLTVAKFKRTTLRQAEKLQLMAQNGASLTDIQEVLDSFETATITASQFRFTPTGMTFRKSTRWNAEPVRLTNFNARIVAEHIEDDGSLEETRVFEIEAELEERKSLIRVPSSRFAAMAWPTAMLGARAIVYPGQGDIARAAIQTLSKGIRQTTIYMHTGWRMIDGVQSFLHSGGAITPTGNRTDVTVRLPESLRYYLLPEPATEQKDIDKAYDVVTTVKNAFKTQLTVPLIGGVFASVLERIDYSLYFAGQSGTRKSELTSMAQAFFGSGFHRMTLPANWGMDSSIALMLKAFRAKNAVLTIDDFAPNGQKNHDDKLHAKAEDVLRAAGNGSGRTTAKVDHSERAGKPSRCLIISSGEEIPKGLSLQNRLLIVPMQLGDIPDKELSMVQGMAREGELAMANAVWIQHVAKYHTTVTRRFNRRCIEFRDRLCLKNKNHARQPTTIAHIISAWYAWISSGVVNKVFSRKFARKLRAEIWESMTASMELQKEQHTTTHPAVYFLDLLRSALLSGRCHLATLEGLQPEGQANLYGWRNGVQQGELAGWIDGDFIYLEPSAAFKAANSQGVSIGEGLPVSPNSLWKRMDEKELIAFKETGRGNKVRTPEINVPAVVILKTSLFEISQRGDGVKKVDKVDKVDSRVDSNALK